MIKYYKLMLCKSYVDMGWGLTTYLKYLIALFGLASLNIYYTLLLASTHMLACFIIGWAWYKYGFFIAQAEVGNQYNLFQKQLREKLKIEKFK